MIAVSLFRRWRPVPLWGMLTGAAALSAALIFSYSRASLLNVVAAIAANLCLERGRLRRILPIAGAFVIAGMAVAGSAAHGLAQTYWLRLASTVEYLFVSPEGVLSGRVASWRTLVDFVSAHPWRILFGIGYKTLPYSDVAGRPVVADNMYLSLLVETGVAGLAALLVFNAAVLQAARRAARSDDVQAAFLGRWMFCFWIGQMVQMLSGDLLTYWRILPVYFWLFAMMAPRADPVH
jgi:O-antigen ligase